MTTAYNTIREHIIQLLDHELTLAQFKQWFFTDDASLAEDDIVYAVKLLFAEYANDDWTDDEMYEMLKTELEKATIGDNPNVQVGTSGSSMTIEVQW